MTLLGDLKKNQEVCVILTGLGKIDTFSGFEKAILRGYDCTLSRLKISLKDRHVWVMLSLID